MLSTYTCKNSIASGTYATVYLFGNSDNEAQLCAVKVANKDIYSERILKKEFRILSLLGEHPGIVSTLGETHNLEIGYGIVMQLYATDLKGIYDSFPWTQSELIELASQFVDQIRPVIHYIHSKQIAHRDIKPDNILVSYVSATQFEFRLADFGHAHWLSGNADTLSVMAPPLSYLAPEACVRAGMVLDGQRLQAIYSNSLVIRAGDIWAAGVTALEIMAREIVEPAPTIRDAILQKIAHCQPNKLPKSVHSVRGLAACLQSMIKRERCMSLTLVLGADISKLISHEFGEDLQQMLQYCPFRRLMCVPKFRDAGIFASAHLPILDAHQRAMFSLLYSQFNWKVVLAAAVLASGWIWSGPQLLAMVASACEFLHAIDGYQYFDQQLKKLDFSYSPKSIQKATIPKVEDYHNSINTFIKHCERSEDPASTAKAMIFTRVSHSPE